jgi:UDP-2,3-diacylglucosamine pyrophosphatase LpxH
VIYLRGNHDDFLDEILPFEIGNFSIVRDTIIESAGKRYYVVHGDIFDSVTTNLKWVAKLGDIGYTLLLWINRVYNNYRIRKGLPYYSLSQRVKARVKGAVSFVDDFEKTLAEVARQKGCQGIITGHIHTAADKMIGDIHYLNSGDWVESLTALVETSDGTWSVLNYYEWLATQDHGRGVYTPQAPKNYVADSHTPESALYQGLAVANKPSETTQIPVEGEVLGCV